MSHVSASGADPARLRRAMRDMVALSTLPAIWAGTDSGRIPGALADVLARTLNLDLVYVHVDDPQLSARVLRREQKLVDAATALAFGQVVHDLGDPEEITDPFSGGRLRAAVTRFGLGEIKGVLLAASARADFPDEADRALLGVAGNHAGAELYRRRIESERRRADESLRRSEVFNRGLIESSRDCIKTLSLDGRLTWISEKGCEILCIDDVPSVLGRSWIDFWEGEHRELARAAVQQAAAGGSGSFVGLYRMQGRERWWDVAVTPICDAAGKPESLLAVSRDTTERFTANARMREDRRVLELLNQTGAALAATLDLQELLQKITDAATELSGAQFGAFFYNVVDDQGEAFQLYTLAGAEREAFEGFGKPRATPVFGPTFRGEGIIRLDDVRKDPRYGQWGPHHGMPEGHLPVSSYLAVPVVSRSGEVIGGLFFGHKDTGVFTERSERIVAGIASQAAVAIDNARLYQAAHKAAQEREFLLESERTARAAAERAAQMKDEFLATVSHELRTPLSAILGWTQVLRLKQASPDELRKGLEAIERNARAQKQLIEDLLDMGRIASGKLRLDAEPVSLGAVLEAAIHSVRPLAESKGVQLHWDGGSTAPGIQVQGDAARLQQVVWNLLSNSIKFTSSGGRIDVSLRSGGGSAEIEVRDSGQGIDPAFIDHVFDRFRQADSSLTRYEGGLGLGLAIVKNLVELHGGRVRASSQGVDRGSTFTVTLPALSSTGRAAGERTPQVQDFRVADFSGRRIVVVEDHPDTRELVSRVLVECGASVLALDSAREALAAMTQEVPDLLVTDIGMPEMDGFTLLTRLRNSPGERARTMPAIALTAFARPEDRLKVKEVGFACHVAKPLEAAEFVSTVARVLREA